MRRPAIALLVVLALGGAWIAYAELWRHGGGKPVAWHDLGRGLGDAELSKPVFLRFRTRRHLEQFLATTVPGRVPKVPPVDFARDEVLLAAVGARSSTGYGVRVSSVSEERVRIVVRVREVTPSLGRPVAARVTYPYLLATIPQSAKRVHFVWLGRP
jgi:hypothetical protein